MDRNGLLDANESDFLGAVLNFINVEGRDSLVNAMLIDRVDEVPDRWDVIGDIEFPDDYDSDSSDDEGDHVESSDDEADNDSVDNAHEFNIDRIRLHDPVVHDHSHCPPFIDMTHTFVGVPCGVCDCDDFCFACCFQENNFQFFKDCYYKIDFDEQLNLANDGIDVARRRPNNELRKYFFKKVFVSLDFGVLEVGERRRLPNCAVTKIRQIYPSETGLYMGFKEN